MVTTAALPSLTIGMSQDDVMKLFKMTLEEKWNTTSGSAGYLSIPMYGETGYVRVNGSLNNKFSASLLRMLVRVDVQVALTGGEKLDLKSVRVYNRATVGMLAPSGVAGETNLPNDLKKVELPLLYDGGEITTGGTPSVGISSVGEIYLFESTAVSETDKKTRLADATCLVVGGCYTPEGGAANTSVETFYRIDFAHIEDADSLKYYYDILRNHNYNIRIVSAWGPGEKTPEEALNTEVSRIEIEVLDWEQGGNIGGDMDGQDVLRVAPGEFDLSYSAHTAAPAETDNKMKVSSTHKDGWYISKITELNGAVETETNGSGWLSTDLAIGVNQSADEVVSVLLTENPDPTPRVGYIYISSGPRMNYKVKVTQLPALRIGKVMWEDYDGITVLADGDKGFTSISILDSDGITQTHTPAVPPVGVISQPLKIGGNIVKVTVTYKGYVHDVPVANCTFNDLEETLTIDDRTLIGKPIHLDKIRGDMNGDYIQVADINLSGYTGLNGVAGNWSPIGTDQLQFTGSYDGSTFNIDNFIINRPATDCIGLFGYAEGAILKNIDIVGGNIIGHRYVAAICGAIFSCKIENCTNAAFVSGNEYIGGICGVISLSTITNCKNIVGATITAKAGGNNAGGIIGRSWSSTIENCTNAATVSGADINTSDIGGICGDNDQVNSVIKNCQNVAGAEINGGSDIGGIAGRNSNGTIKDCTNAATVTGLTYVAGIVGQLDGGTISGVKNTGDITGGASRVGGICGDNTNGRIDGCTNSADVTGTGAASDYVGGIVGMSFGATSVITNCQNSPRAAGVGVSGRNNIGGIAGKHAGTYGSSNIAIESCTNSAPIKGEGSIGGLFGSNAGTISGTGNSNTGTITGSGNALGGIVGTNESTGSVSDITNTVAITSSTGSRVGGIVGFNSGGTVKDCTNTVAISGVRYVGGIVGYSNTTASTITNCTNTSLGTIEGTSEYVGGIAGSHEGTTTDTKSCINSGTIKGTNYVGGLFGHSEAKITGVLAVRTNTGKVTGLSHIGGICGQAGTATLKTATVSDCSNSGDITYTGTENEIFIAGIVGRNYGTISGCTNIATIKGKALYVAGISGWNYNTILDCVNTGTIKGEKNQVAGIAGVNSNLVSRCINTGEVTGVEAVGGITGQNNSGGITSASSNTGNVNGTKIVGGVTGNNNVGGTVSSINSGIVRGTTNTEIGGISGKGITSFSYNLGSVSTSPAGAIVGGNTVPVSCYFGGNASGMTASAGSTKFSDQDIVNAEGWPKEAMEGWKLATNGGPWESLGGWNNGSPIYPSLANLPAIPTP